MANVDLSQFKVDADAMHKEILELTRLSPNLSAQQANMNMHQLDALQQITHAYRNEQQTKANLHAKARGMLIQRMGGVASNFNVDERDFLMCHVANSTVYVFFLLNGREGVTTEDINMFPSDKLVAQLRMVIMA